MGGGPVSWTPRWRHVSQIHADGSGWNDCWEAALARYLRERDTPGIAGDGWTLINAISLAARGEPDTPDNLDTTLPECDQSLLDFDCAVNWTASYQAALSAPWAICLVDGRKLSPAQYPPSWFNAAPGANHFILWLPQLHGAANWFNDPLAYTNGQKDCQYDLGSVARAFSGAYLLPSTGNGELSPRRVQARARCGLLTAPRHGSHAVTIVPAGGQALDLDRWQADGAGTTWGYFQYRDKYGWAPFNNFKE